MCARPSFVFNLEGHVGLVSARHIIEGRTKVRAVRIYLDPQLEALGPRWWPSPVEGRAYVWRMCIDAAGALMRRTGVRLVLWRWDGEEEAVREVLAKDDGPVPAREDFGCGLHDDCCTSDQLAHACLLERIQRLCTVRVTRPVT
jgi:hypothetical protein